MTKKLTRFFILFAVISSLLVLSALAANVGAAQVTASTLNFRSQPSTDSSIIGWAGEGETVLVLDDLDNGWCKVRYKGNEGYMASKYLKLLGETEMKLGAGKVTGDSVRLRSQANYSCSTLKFLNKGYMLDIIGVSGEWYKAVYNGTTGYIHSDYVSLVSIVSNDTVEMRDRLVDTAEKYIGCKYVWGGTSPTVGFDCSGLINYTYVACGIQVSRTSSSLYAEAAKIARSELKYGDLVFFASPSSWSVSHVGMYIGDGRFIHASSGAGKVVVSELSNTYYSTYFYGAGRILK
jgi:uncharacterized protein YgiM (DUF1202 family)